MEPIMAGAQRGAERSLKSSLVGTWELFFREDRTQAGVVHFDPGLGADPRGLLVYDSGGHFSAQFMKQDRTSGESFPQAGTPQNNSRAVGGYDAYFGRYSVDDVTGEVTQTLDGALAVENVGMVVTRRMVVSGDELTLRLPTTAMDGTPVVRTLKWRRVA